MKARVVAKLDGPATARLVVSRHKDLSSPLYFGPTAPTDDLMVRLDADGLAPDAAYHYGLELDGELDTAVMGGFRTHPVLGAPADFTIAASSCAGSRPRHPGEGAVAVSQALSNHPVFDTIRALDPLMFLHLGDMHYYDIGSGTQVPGHDLAAYRGAYDDVFAQSRQHRLYRSVATQYSWDDHDFGPNDSDASHPGRDSACRVYRERVPHYPLADDHGIWQQWKIGRIHFVMLDVRSFRCPDAPHQTMLGTAQKDWLAEVLTHSTAKFLVVTSGSRWFDDTSPDTWDSFRDERDALIELFDATGWRERMCILAGDVHATAIDTGGNSPGGIAVFQFASLDSTPHIEVQHHYDTGPSRPGRNQYGTVRFTDDGDSITITGVAFCGDEPVNSHQWRVDAD